MGRRMRIIAIVAFTLGVLALVIYSLRAQVGATYPAMGSIPDRVEKHRSTILLLVEQEQKRLADHRVWVESRPANSQIQLDSGAYMLREDWLTAADAAKAQWDQAEADLQP